MACSTIIQHNGYIGRVRVEISRCVHKLDVGYESQSEQVQFFWKMASNGGLGMRQAHHLRRMPMGGIGGIFNLYFILKLLNS